MKTMTKAITASLFAVAATASQAVQAEDSGCDELTAIADNIIYDRLEFDYARHEAKTKAVQSAQRYEWSDESVDTVSLVVDVFYDLGPSAMASNRKTLPAMMGGFCEKEGGLDPFMVHYEKMHKD